jgi:hypothetical protein
VATPHCRDGKVAQSCVPPYDFRISYAMETHGVEAARLKPTPLESELAPGKPISETVEQVVTMGLPVLALVATYLATQLAAKMKVKRGWGGAWSSLHALRWM